jgi:chromosome segregation ATPase
MTKDKLKDDIIRTIFYLNSDISNKDRELLIKLFNSIIDYTNNTELEQEIGQLQQKYNELVETVEELETKLQTYSDKVDNLETRVQALENSSQS